MPVRNLRAFSSLMHFNSTSSDSVSDDKENINIEVNRM
jgi:hypothetical protein